jgi:hypothetical protein
VLLSKLVEDLVLVREKDRFCRHEATDNKELISLSVPREVMDWAGGGFDFGNFEGFIIVDVEAILAVVGLACRVVVGLKHDQEFI